MNKSATKYIILPLLVGFLAGGMLFFSTNNNELIFDSSNKKIDFFISVWGEGQRKLFSLNSKTLSVINDNYYTTFNLKEDCKFSINPITKKEEYMNQVEKEAETCSEIEYQKLDAFGFKKASQTDFNTGEEVRYFLIFDKVNQNFAISHLIIKK